MGGKIHETLFQAFEIANIIMDGLHNGGSKNFELPMSSLKDVKTVIEAGHPEGWGRVLEFPVNKDNSGMGYRS